MQQRNIGKDLWEIFSPLLLKSVVALVIEVLIIMACYVQRLPEIANEVMTQEQTIALSTEISNQIYQYITEITAFSALVTIPFLVIMINNDLRKEKKEGVVSNKKAPAWKYIFVVGISIPFSLGLNNILLLSNLAEYSEAYQETAEALYSPAFPVQILCVGIIIPIMEEMIFRGLIYRRMRRNVSMIKAMIFTALFFGFYHGNSVQFIFACLSGFLLAYLYEKYGSLKAPILGHMFINIVSCALTEVDVFTWIFSDMTRMVIITALCAAIASTMFILIQRIEEKHCEREEKEQKEQSGKDII